MLWLLHPDWRIEMPSKADGADSDMAIPSGGLTLMLVHGDTRLTAPEGTHIALIPERFSPDYGVWATC